MPIKLNTASGGGVILTGANTASDKTITVPADDGTMIYANSSGNVGIGTTTMTRNLNVSGSNAAVGVNLNNSGTSGRSYSIFSTNSSASAVGALAFYDDTAGAYRAVIDSSGNLLVGNAAQVWDERILGYRSTNNVVGGFYSTSSSYTSSVIRCQTETAAGTGWYLFEGRAAGGSFQYGIRGNGTVATSDERRKKNIEPARSYLQDICSIPVVKYNWKTDLDDAPKELGWIAQDVAKVFPNMVVTHHDGPNDDQEVLLLKKEVFLPMLMKCIQEQQQMIETLQAKVAALEAK